jgi:acetyl-CoA carboxylase biotin carboxyl carrier protein
MAEKILAPLAGKIIDIQIGVGDSVEEDQEIVIIEAMKMETPIYAPCDGKIIAIHIKKNDNVEEDDLIAEIAPE